MYVCAYDANKKRQGIAAGPFRYLPASSHSLWSLLSYHALSSNLVGRTGDFNADHIPGQYCTVCKGQVWYQFLDQGEMKGLVSNGADSNDPNDRADRGPRTDCTTPTGPRFRDTLLLVVSIGLDGM
ncbi:hypothetical protein RB195_017099 [Necator americanus]|uniref:Uncharacterized protein n=1 Tax=Necator americanus TaxID=51031 RepID=A0ABR1C3L2_NECAM